MEINAKVYAVADREELLEQLEDALEDKLFLAFCDVQELEPCAVLPLTKTWYGFAEDTGMTDGPEGWISCLRECAAILKNNGAILVEFRSPDHPDDYLEYAYTTPGGGAGSGSRPGLIGYKRALGNDDITTAIDELISERTAEDRQWLCKRRERKEAIRKQKGDYEITPDGVLKRYWGYDSDVVIPDGVKEIGESAFVDLKGVERMILEDEEYDAPEMRTLTIPGSVQKIGSYAFAYCQNLERVNMTDSVTSIGDRAFEGCESLKEIHLSGGLTRIEDSTFFLCEGLKSIEIPEGITHIEESAFRDCWSLNRVKLPDSLVSIGKEAFKGSDLKRISIPKNVSEIGEDAFPEGTIKESRG